MRTEFQQTESVTVDEAVRRADDSASGTVLLSDTGDSVLGGSGGDSTVILDAILRAGIRGRAAVPMIDSGAAALLSEAGAGATMTLSLGGRSTPLFTPLPVTGVVRAVGDGAVDAPDLPQGRINMGRCVAFDVGPVTLLVTEQAGAGGIHPAAYRHVGVEPARSPDGRDEDRIELPVHGAVQLRSDPSGDSRPTQSDLTSLPWQRAPRPIYPLDEPATWRG